MSEVIFVQLGLGLKLKTKIQIHYPPPPHRNFSEGSRPSRMLIREVAQIKNFPKKWIQSEGEGEGGSENKKSPQLKK